MKRRYVFGLAALQASILISEAHAAGYYNLGSFWRASPAGACSSIAFVQSSGDRTSDSSAAASVSLPSAETSGNFLVVEVFYTDGGGDNATVSLSDTLGNTYYPTLRQVNPNGGVAQIWYAQNIAGGANTITAVLLPSPAGLDAPIVNLFAQEYSGVALSNPVDVLSGRSAPSAGTTATPGSMTSTSNCNDLVVGFLQAITQSGCMTGGGGAFATRAADTSCDYVAEDNIGSGGTAPGAAVNASATMDTSNNFWSATQVAFRAQGSTAPTSPAQLAFSTTSQTLANTWTCSGALTVQAQNGSGGAFTLHSGLNVSLGGSNLAYYSDSSCTTPISVVQIPGGASSATVYFVGTASGSLTASATGTGGLTASQTETISAVRSFTWIGGAGCGGTWSTGTCWQGGSAPGSGNTAYFGTSCTVNCTATLGASTTIAALRIAGGGVNLGSSTLTLATGDLQVLGGTLNEGTGSLITQQGGVYLSGGTALLSGTLSVTGHYLVTGGTVTSSGTLQLEDPNWNSGQWIVLPGTLTYNDVKFTDRTYFDKTRLIAGTLTVGGTLTLAAPDSTEFLVGGVIDSRGDINIQDLGYTYRSGMEPTVIRVSGAGNRTLDASATAQAFLPALKIELSGGATVAIKGAPIVTADFTYSSGAVDFTTFNSTLEFDDFQGNNAVWNVTPGAIAYNHVTFADDTYYYKTRFINGTMTINGTLTLDGQITSQKLAGGTLDAKGDVVIKDFGYSYIEDLPPATVRLSGSGSQLLDASSTTEGSITSLTIASTGGPSNPVIFKGAPLVSTDYTYTSGTLDFTTFGATLVFDDFMNINAQRAITPGTITYGNVRFADDTYYGKIRFINGTMTIGGTLTLGGQIAVQSLAGGTLDAKGDVIIQDFGYRYDSAQTPATLQVSGSSDQLLDASATSTAFVPSLKIAATGGPTHPLKFKGTVLVSSDYTYVSGTLDFATYGATLGFDDGVPAFLDWTLTPGSVTYGNVSFLDDTPYGKSRTIVGTMTVGGTLTLDTPSGTQTLTGGVIDAKGNVSILEDGYTGTTQLNFSGTNAATLTIASGAAVPQGDITVNKPGTTLTLTADTAFNSTTGQNLNLTSGTIVMSGHKLTVKSTLTMSAGTVINEGGSCVQGGSGQVCTGSGFTSSKSSYLRCNSCVGCTGTATITCP